MTSARPSGQESGPGGLEPLGQAGLLRERGATVRRVLILGIAAICLLLAACAGPKFIRPDTPVSLQERDEAECRTVARMIQPNTGGMGGLAGSLMLMSGMSAQAASLRDCMTTKGYRVAD